MRICLLSFLLWNKLLTRVQSLSVRQTRDHFGGKTGDAVDCELWCRWCLRSSVLVLPIEMHDAVANFELPSAISSALGRLPSCSNEGYSVARLLTSRSRWRHSRCVSVKQIHAGRELLKGDDPKTDQWKGVHSYLPGWQPKEKEA